MRGRPTCPKECVRRWPRRTQLLIDGSVGEGFEPVRDAFVENFTRRGELGGACCIYQHGVKVVDLWGGVRDRASGEPWRARHDGRRPLDHEGDGGDGHGARALARLARLRGARLPPTGPSSPRTARSGSRSASCSPTRRGCSRSTSRSTATVVADLDRLAEIMARQRPAWEPGERQAYHAISLGFYEGELIRRVDPAHRTLGQVLRRGDRPTPRRGLLHPHPRVDSERTPGAAGATEPLEAADRVPAAARVGRDESTLGPLPVAGRQSGDDVLSRSGSGGRAQPGGSVRGRCRQRARDREGVRRLRHAAAASSGCAARRSRR